MVSPGGSKATAANGVGGGQSGATAASTGTASKPHHSHQQQQQQQDPKPVECNLCHRKFKNIPALNGHMRLHGGYFKKTCPIVSAIYGFRDPSVLVGAEEYFVPHPLMSTPRVPGPGLNHRTSRETKSHDSESKKCEKKEVSGPPLQTASMSVRALIEEKIIQKRITNPHLAVSHAQTTHQITYATADASGRSGAPLHYSVQSPGGSVPGKDPPDLNIKLSSFVVPAPPPQAEKTTRRHSDSEHFVSPRLPSGGGTTTEQEAVALAELLLKRSSGASKVAVKRASSDPGSHQNSNPNSASPSPQPQQQLQLSFQGSETYSLAGVGVSYQTDDGGYFSPSIQDDVFQQSVQDTMLLNGMDPAQLAETIQFQAASLLQDQTTAEQLQDIASLEDYQNATGMQDSVHSPGVGQYQSHSNHSIHQDFQAVLNSPLPVNLVDFSAYGQQSPIPKDLTYQPTHSPLDQKEFINYTNSPHTVLTNSPLPSPLAHHDSPSFTYPTPPASQEGQSPSFGHGGMITSNTGCGLPLSSPQQGSTDSFVQSVISHGGHVPPVSSPLSAAFYTTNMSSSAAVEEALSEVLPAESMSGQGCMRSHGLGLYQSLVNPSPPPHSPLSATPVPSPLSISSVPASSSSVSSPLPSSYAQTQGQISFPLSPHHTLQSQMMPNSEDPLLSSSPKDFCSRKKFDFGGIHSFKLLGNGMVDFGMANSGLTGIMVDSNGELKFFQAANSHPAKNMMVSGSVSTNISSASAKPVRNKIVVNNHSNQTWGQAHVHTNSTIPASPIRVARKRSRPEPLYILPHPVPSYRSRLRAPRLQEPGSSSPPPQYTPPPMLSPARQGQGLFWQAVNVPHSASLSPATWPSSTTVSRNGTIESCGQEESSMPTETAPESDATPHINLGPDFQCVIPQWNPDREKANREPSYEHLLWDPGISKVSTDAEVTLRAPQVRCYAKHELTPTKTIMEWASQPVYLSSALAPAAPTTLPTAWTGLQSIFSEPSVTTPPQYTAPALAIGSCEGHCLTFSRTNGKPLFPPLVKVRQQWRVYNTVISGAIFSGDPPWRTTVMKEHFHRHSLSFRNYPLPPIVTHVARTVPLPPTATHVAGTVPLPPTATHVAGTLSTPPTRLRVAGTVFSTSNLIVPSDGDLTGWDTPAAPARPIDRRP
uniref:C2H2-type domain-containing protein n=1 Tax=Timema shepardi TaxID=629360 RepID=A0A7R9AMW0_TIMSH|nr:unnamed protein product [Timema shepardi]